MGRNISSWKIAWWGQLDKYPNLKKYAEDWHVINIPKQIFDNDKQLQQEAMDLLLNGKSFDVDGKQDDNRNWCLELITGYSDDFPELENECVIVSLREVKAWC